MLRLSPARTVYPNTDMTTPSRMRETYSDHPLNSNSDIYYNRQQSSTIVEISGTSELLPDMSISAEQKNMGYKIRSGKYCVRVDLQIRPVQDVGSARTTVFLNRVVNQIRTDAQRRTISLSACQQSKKPNAPHRPDPGRHHNKQAAHSIEVSHREGFGTVGFRPCIDPSRPGEGQLLRCIMQRPKGRARQI